MRWIVPAVAMVLGSGLLVPDAVRAAPEVIGLKDGHQVVGEVVAEKPNALYVDLGFDLLRIPREQVVHRGKPGESGAANGPSPRAGDSDSTGFCTWTSPTRRHIDPPPVPCSAFAYSPNISVH